MAQINRIRVNNIKYNFGTQFYDDFLMRLSGKNTIYDLANGGGKSILMLLLLQNMLPNCTLDDKQPIEKLFRSGNNNTVIHSLVEWKLDSCDVKNGFKYMTTGFCARKGREQGDETDTGSETANIEYFNYCIFYREFGENDIKNLPLVKDGERITYNGLKSYLRDLERKDFGVSVRIFERKGDYQNFISNYGLYESQWEIIRGINKTEGHVRTYFENNYKTTRKVVEDLLIEEIIEKSYNNRIRKGSQTGDDEEMARTLLDIKDKLIELSRRRGEINRYDEQISLLENFGAGLWEFKEMYSEKESIQKKLLDTLLICRGKANATKAEIEELVRSLEELKDKYSGEERRVSLGELETEYIELEKLDSLIEETTARLKGQSEIRERIRKDLFLRENAADYSDYLKNKKLRDETRELINSRSLKENDALKEMAGLAAAKEIFVSEKIKGLSAQKELGKDRLESTQKEYSRTFENEQEIFGKIKKSEGVLQGLEKEADTVNKELDALMQSCGMLVADGAEELYEKTVSKIHVSEQEIAETEQNIREIEKSNTENYNERIALEGSLAKLSEEENFLLNELECNKASEAKLDKMKTVYGGQNAEQLDGITEELLHKLNREQTENEQILEKLLDYEKHIQNRKLPEYDGAFNNLLEYLKGRYGEDVVSGRELIEKSEAGAKILEQIPQAPFCIFAGNTYEQIAMDKVTENLNTGNCVIPILPFSVIEEGKTPFDSETILAVCRNMSFLWDDAALAAELQKTSEDIARYREILKKNADKCRLVSEDNIFIKSIKGKDSEEILKNRIDRISRDKEKVTARQEKIIIKQQENAAKSEELTKWLKEARKELDNLKKECEVYSKTAKQNRRLEAVYSGIKEEQAELKAAKREYDNVHRRALALKGEVLHAEEEYRLITDNLEAVQNEFDSEYKIYLTENIPALRGLSEEETDARMSALKKIIAGENGDIADKERLLASYENTMKKSADSIIYRGMSLEEAAQTFGGGRLAVSGMEEMLKLKEKAVAADREIKETENELDAQSARKNRIEGSIEHGRRRYEDKYGEFVRENISSPQSFIVSHRQEMSNIQERILAVEKDIKNKENAGKDILFMEKDLERIIRSAGLEIPENTAVDAGTEEISADDYDKLQKQYEKLNRDEAKLNTRFIDNKQKLVDALTRLDAYELAEEVRNSLIPPKGTSEVEDMLRNLKETNEYIALERDRIDKSISDMERIKDSFVNRCVQICSNIKTELDRLPKLSRINLDNEDISVITLSVPYIKDEMYKDRMSVYINETVSNAEAFNSPGDKLKYMKSRLSWKKLFSVIVTDMNSIKLCLYKREHIKDRSRYLKYEEAVGSTGQSQGIYIQFLIAVIHYISSINAAGKDTAVTGKTIFIDNPFGAAKDVYIWEPIFKLLKTNHVQLIVPARGATPAITKMFDINYVLGQKLVAKMLQTVVVDYRSQVKAEEMEYDTMEYEQTTLDIL